MQFCNHLKTINMGSSTGGGPTGGGEPPYHGGSTCGGGVLWRKKVKPGRRLLAVRASPHGAVTYSPASAVPSARRFRSTIGAAWLNFSVRDGKRWIPRAVPALISFFLAAGLRPRGMTWRVKDTVYTPRKKHQP